MMKQILSMPDTTLNVPDGTDDVLHGDTDVDASSSLTVTGIRTGTRRWQWN